MRYFIIFTDLLQHAYYFGRHYRRVRQAGLTEVERYTAFGPDGIAFRPQ